MAPLSKHDIEYDAVDDSSSSSNCFFPPAGRPTKMTRTASTAAKKSVSFSQYSEQYVIPSTEDWTDEERHSSFLSPEDYHRIRTDNAYTLRAMNHGVFPDDDRESFRGLENGMADYYYERKHVISTAVTSVLTEQGRNRPLDSVWVDRVYAKFTARSSIHAIRAGGFDARVAAAARTDQDDAMEIGNH